MPIDQSSKQYTVTYQGGMSPDRAGFMVLPGSTSVPSGWLLCNGQAVSRTTYADLFTAIGTAFGVGDGSTTFNLPNLTITIDGVNRTYIIKAFNDVTSAASVGLDSIGGAKVDTYLDYDTIATPANPAAGDYRTYFKNDGKLYVLNSSGQESQLAGGLQTSSQNTNFTAQPGFHYLVDTSTASRTATLPTGSAGAVIRFSDEERTWGINSLVITPASGQSIDGFAVNETLVCDITGAFVQLMWDGAKWVIDTSGFGSTSAGYIQVPITSNTTAVNGRHYLADTTSSAFSLTLPTGVTGMAIKATDAGRTWHLNNLTIIPATGERIDGLAINETMVCDTRGGWIELSYNGSTWVVGTTAYAANQTPVATPTISGTVFKPRFQTKILASSVSGNGSQQTVASLTFNNLTIGKTYKLSGYCYIATGISNAQNEVQFFDGTTSGTRIGSAQINPTYSSGITTLEVGCAVNFLWTATTTTMTTAYSAANSGSNQLVGSGTRSRTFLQLEELDVETTTAWT